MKSLRDRPFSKHSSKVIYSTFPLYSLLSLSLIYSLKLTCSHAGAALDTLLGIDLQSGTSLSGSGVVGDGDSLSRALSGAEAAAGALFSVDPVFEQILTYARGTLLVADMCDVLVAEVTEGRKHGVGRGLSEAAQGVGFDEVAQLFHLVEHFHGALTLGDLVEHFEQTLGADTAGSTFTAAFVNGKLKEELGDVDHAVVLVHNDEAAGAHH